MNNQEKDTVIQLVLTSEERNENIENLISYLHEYGNIRTEVFQSGINNDYSNKIIMFPPNTINIKDNNIINIIEQALIDNSPIILVNTSQSDLNSLYSILGEDNIPEVPENSNCANINLFAIEYDNKGRCYTFTNNKECVTDQDYNNNGESILRWLNNTTRPDYNELNALGKEANGKLVSAVNNSSSDASVDLLSMAKQYVQTVCKDICEKHVEITYYVVSCHLFDHINDADSSDWYYINQYCILDGSNKYEKYWAGTRVNVDGGSWYVGQGEVCLYYVDYYQLDNYLKDSNPSNVNHPYESNLIYTTPTSENGQTTYTNSVEVGVSGEISYDGSSGGFSLGVSAGFSSSVSFTVQDCECENLSMEKNQSAAQWKYIFKRAERNTKAGQWQRLLDPAKLSHTVFTPSNIWIWKIPSNQRGNYTTFTSDITARRVSTITRYSGSQGAKDIEEEAKTQSAQIPLSKPPLMGCDNNQLSFQPDKSNKQIHVESQGKWKIEIPSDATWCNVYPLEGDGKFCEISISVAKNIENQPRTATLKLRSNDELEEIKIIQLN